MSDGKNDGDLSGYSSSRSDYDGLRVQEIPGEFIKLARRAAAAAGMEISPDICILNLYGTYGRLGLHQDKDERAETIRAGVPVVSISLGDSAKFLLGRHETKRFNTRDRRRIRRCPRNWRSEPASISRRIWNSLGLCPQRARGYRKIQS